MKTSTLRCAWVVVTFLACLITKPAASTPIREHRTESLHLWQMTAQDNDGIMFIDQNSKRQSADGWITLWALQTLFDKSKSVIDASNYKLINLTVDCHQRATRVNAFTAYANGQGTFDGGHSGFQIVDPESVGEIIIQAVCRNQLVYSSNKPVTSIEAAIVQGSEHLSSASERHLLLPEELLNRKDISEIAQTFNRTMSNGGMSGVAELVRNCYSNVSDLKTKSNIKALARCVTFDFVAYGSDTAFQKEFKKQSGKDIPSSDYFDENSWTTRINMYGSKLTQTSPIITPENIRSYANDVEKELLRVM